MRHATIEILHKDEDTIFGKSNGRFFVKEYEDGEERGGSFFQTMDEAHKHVLEYQDEGKSVVDLFSVPVFIGDIDLKKIKLKSDMGKSFLSRTPSSFGKENSLDPESGKYLMALIAGLLEQKIPFQSFYISLNEIWRNEYLDHDFQEPHIHVDPKAPCQFSFIIYEAFASSPHTIFFNPAKNLIQASFGGEAEQMGTDLMVTPPVKKGQIIVFPSYIEHMVNRNSDQVTISGNISFKFQDKDAGKSV